MTTQNPYHVFGAIDTIAYIERDADAKLLEEIAENQGYPYFCAARQSGKSSLISRTIKRLSHLEYACAVVDLSTFSLNNYDRFLQDLLENLADILKITSSIIETKHLERTLLSWCDQLSRRIVIFLDEVDVLLAAPFREQFLSKIRSIFVMRSIDSRLTGIQFVLSGSAHPSRLISNPLQSPFNVGAEIPLLDLSFEQVKALSVPLEAKGIHIGDNIIELIYRHTNGVVYLTQLIFHRLWDELIKNNRSASPEYVDIIVSDVINNSQQDIHFFNIFRLITSSPAILNAFQRFCANGNIDANSLIDLQLSGLSSYHRPFRCQLYERVFGENGPLELLPKEDSIHEKHAIQKIPDPIASYIGTEIGQYRITEVLGRGGMGAVFLAIHKTLNLRCAIKVLWERWGTADGSVDVEKRFINEATALASIHHSSLVRLFDFGHLPDGSFFIQMEYLQGESLRERLKNRDTGRLGLHSSLILVGQIASALASLHEKGIVHRDLKPSNIFIVPDRASEIGERAMVIDLGVAQIRGTRTTASGQNFGTARYMSPEQCENSGLIDDRSDVYSLGLILYEMLTSESPYPATGDEPLAWLYAHVEHRPRPLRKLLPNAPGEIEEFIAKMLDKLPAQRPSMMEVVKSIKQLGDFSEKNEWRQNIPILQWISWKRLNYHVGIYAFLLLIMAMVTVVVRESNKISRFFKNIRNDHTEEAIAHAQAPPGMVYIPSKAFLMGSTVEEVNSALALCKKYDATCQYEEMSRELPRRLVKVQSFYLDKAEITNQQYAEFLNQPIQKIHLENDRLVYDGRTLLVDLFPENSGIAYHDGSYRAKPGVETLPVVQVTWNGARQFCRAQGKDLPSEAQWERAARENSLSTWPWGNEWPRCEGVAMDRAKGGTCQRLPSGPSPVAANMQDVTPTGVHDLAGNVREWVLDVFLVPYPDCGSCQDPVAMPIHHEGSDLLVRVVRGGSWYLPPISGRAAARSRWKQDYLSIGIGFRCAAARAR